MHPHGPPPVAMRRRARREMEGAEPVDRQLLVRVWHFCRKYRRRLLAYFALISVGAMLDLIPPLLFRRIIDDGIPTGDRGLVTVLAAGALALAFVSTGLDLLQRWLSSTVGEGLILDLRTALYAHVVDMPIAFFTRTQTGALTSRMNGDVIGAQRALTGTGGQVVSNALTVTFTLTAMLILEWRLTLLALLIVPFFLIPANRIGGRLTAITREGMELNAAMNATMTERFNVAGAMLVKLFGDRDREVAAFGRRAGRVRDIGVRSAMYNRVFYGALAMIATVGTVIVYWVGAQRVISGAISVGTLVALAAYVGRIYGPLTNLTNARLDILLAFVSFERVFELLDTPVLIEDRPDATDLRDPVGAIDIDDVWFGYPSAAQVSLASLEGEGTSDVPLDERPGGVVLHGIDLHVEPGQLVALVGPSGAGKTTLASLLPRLYDTTKGRVRIDGHDVRDLTQASLRRAIGVVTQDPHLFHDTVGNNLRYGAPSATDADLDAACRAAQLHDVIAALPDGYDTLVGERGYRMSGGEKQRLAIARMLLKDPAIVVLDEATSHLDAENELQIQEALAVALRGRTAVVIAHRLSTIHSADLIVVIDRGRVVDQGRHADLMAAGGLYADLYRTFTRDGAAGNS